MGVIDYGKLIEKLENENDKFDTTEAQREANHFRIKYLKMFNRPKGPDTPYVPLNLFEERLKNGRTITPNKLLNDE